jgi:hypothetical protein
MARKSGGAADRWDELLTWRVQAAVFRSAVTSPLYSNVRRFDAAVFR